MKPVRWAPHALENLVVREIDRGAAEEALANPDLVVPDSPNREVYMRRYVDDLLQQQMLIRLILEHGTDEDVVVTVYKTSKIAKYMTRGQE